MTRQLRSLVPSTALLSRAAPYVLLSRLVDGIARPAWRLVTPQPLPPLRLIVRTGVGNNVLLPHYYYLTAGSSVWLYAFASGFADLESTIVDIGSGVGKTALTLRDLSYHGICFTGTYYGFDVDAEMVEWCRSAFPSDRFRFVHVDTHSGLYNPLGEREQHSLAVPDGSADLVFSQSLFSHLLEDGVRHYLHEGRRMLRPGGRLLMTFFCLDDLETLGMLGHRWSFCHAIGAARVEDERYPESAVAYSKSWMINAARDAGFESAEVVAPSYQSSLICTF